ncbi:hypothetical protein ASPVEDRAFT_138797 [Aspergillus versicolor CBS 583.65]|uniref:Ysc84 actin-binding domain-containing protein n=1 Tax=Aspergillus versicolor CBS 583.65 TaxID=1036611 RepID=A0A1L9PWK0_ASPVE|nr:uncharacterized protein ASPVEDRAFT_138797 [Aspergillus versicolor CBS 583.65]OJJ05812.1 hypothetical protein ASPVEDRAFT_138797 [Aspergillus versicolor CBS 583.65]
MHNPLPASLGSECKKATQILDSFVNGSWRGSPGRELPERVLREAKGIAILTVTKAGFLGSARFGSGVLIARLPDGQDQDTEDGATSTASPGGGRWSPPSAIGIFGGGFGGQVGFELTDFVFIFNSASSLASFSKSGSLTVSGNISIAFGPLGRSAEIAGGVSGAGAGKMMSFAKTKGLFGGVSLESGVLVERRGANKRFYGKNVKTAEILGGRAVLENEEREGDAVRELMRALGDVFDASSARAGEERGPESVSAPAVAPTVAPTVPAAELPAELPAEPVSGGPQLGQAAQNTAGAGEAVDREAQAQSQPVRSG